MMDYLSHIHVKRSASWTPWTPYWMVQWWTPYFQDGCHGSL